MSQILQFPKEKSKRVRQMKKVEGQKVFLTLSLFSFILIAVLSNEQVMRQQRPVYLISDNSPHSIEQVNRAIASAQPMNLFRDVEWEHKLAKRLAEENTDRSPASQKVTLFDQLRYGVLAGKYRMTSVEDLASNGPKLKEIEYIESAEINDRPVLLRDSKGFLSEYRSLLPVSFKTAALAKKTDTSETWTLVSEQGKPVGQAVLRFNENSQFLGMKVQGLDRVSAE